METLNHSHQSDVFQDRELIEAVLQKTDDSLRLNESGGSRLSSLVLTHPSLRSTGTLSRPASIVSKHSTVFSRSQSQERLSDVIVHDILDKSVHDQYEQLKVNVLVLSLLSICSLVLGSLAVQLIVAMSKEQTTVVSANSLAVTNATRLAVLKVATALSTFVVALDLSCLLVCSLQTLIVVKLLKIHLGDERAVKFLRECSSSRFIAVTGFYVSIPIFLLAIMLYIILQFTSTSAIIAVVVLTFGAIFSLTITSQNFYHWKIEKARANAGLPVFDTSSPKGDVSRQKELSTLV